MASSKKQSGGIGGVEWGREEFEISHVLSRELTPIDKESLVCTFPIGMKVKATVVTNKVNYIFGHNCNTK